MPVRIVIGAFDQIVKVSSRICAPPFFRSSVIAAPSSVSTMASLTFSPRADRREIADSAP